MFGVVKKILFWSYGRTSWQYDVLSALILAFIFLTPQAWFKTGEPPRALSHHETHDIVRLRAERETDADLALALRDDE